MTYRLKMAERSMKLWMLFIPITLLASIFILPELPSSPMRRDAFWAGKMESDTNEDIVFVGDSRVYRGIDPLVFGRMTKLKARNFGFSSASPDSILIEHAINCLSSSGKKLVVIAVSANSFMSSSIENTHFKSVKSWSVSDKWVKYHIYPLISFFDNRSVADIFKYMKSEGYYEHYNISNGFAASYKIPADSNAAVPAYQRQFEREQYSKDAESKFINYVLRLKSSGYHPVIIRVPCSYSMIQLEDMATKNAIPRLMRELMDRGIDVLPYVSDGLSSYDGSHLDEQSAELYSQKLSQDIGRLYSK